MAIFSLLRSTATPPQAFHIPAASPHPRTTAAGGFPAWTKTTNARNLLLQCMATSRAFTEGVIQNGFIVTKPHKNIVEDDTQQDKHKGDGTKLDEDKDRMVEMIRSMLWSMEDGEISVSPYDTAWVALVEDIGGSGGPQFPTSLDWISNNQLADGSWGEAAAFSAHDRILNTLACVVALRTWKIHDDKANRGIAFIRKNIDKLEDENEEHMPIGFEVALPALIDKAKNLGIGVPDSSALQQIYAKRDFKLTRIPWEIMHDVPTTLLHSLEGMSSASGLDWHKLLNLQCSDGSFLFSPSSTAFALQQTKDESCLKYLLKHVTKFNGGVPNVYPVDLFEHLWVVDRLQRLGISRYFQSEIEAHVDYVYRYWTDKGIGWARNSEVKDIDDTSMGFRLLRLHGYQVSADVFSNFKQNNEFFCFAGQSNEAVTGMYNLYRASQMKFPGEDILGEARKYSYKFLQEKRAKKELVDKWIITKDLPGEVGYALDVPWYASLPRLETRFFLEQYGGDDDVWIGKTLYRMPFVNNKTYLDLAKLDYNNCQELHQSEWKSIQRWYKDCSLGKFGLSERSLLQAYYIAAAIIFEPERSHERLAWAKTSILMETISSYFDQKPISNNEKRAFINDFEHGNLFRQKFITKTTLVGILITTLSELLLGTIMARGVDIHHHLYRAWHKWLSSLQEGDVGEGDAELLVCTLTLCSSASNGRFSDELLLSHPTYQHLLQITTRVCHNLVMFSNHKASVVEEMEGGRSGEITQGMEEMVKVVVVKSAGREGELDSGVKRRFLDVATSYYYTAHCSPSTISYHMAKVLFQRVD